MANLPGANSLENPISRGENRASTTTAREPMVEVYQDADLTHHDQKWRWRLRGGNGEIMCTGESHSSPADCLRAVERIEQVFGETPPVTVFRTPPKVEKF